MIAAQVVGSLRAEATDNQKRPVTTFMFDLPVTNPYGKKYTIDGHRKGNWTRWLKHVVS